VTIAAFIISGLNWLLLLPAAQRRRRQTEDDGKKEGIGKIGRP
jgi:hypothetical protein